MSGATEIGPSLAYHVGPRRPSLEEASHLHHQLAQSPTYGKSGRKASTSTDLYGSTGTTGDLPILTEQKDSHETVILKDPTALARLWDRILDPTLGISLETHRYFFRSYQNAFQGSKLIDSLISQDANTSRVQAIAIGQALMNAGYFSSVSNLVMLMDGSDLYQPCERPALPVDTTDSEADQDLQEPLWLQELADSPFQTVKRTSGPSKADHRHRSGDGSSFSFAKASRLPTKQLQVDIYNLRESLEDGVEDLPSTQDLDDAYRDHETNYLDRLSKGNDLTDEWRHILMNLADDAVKAVQPELKYSTDEMDIRCYVKVKCVAGGDKNNSRLIPGEVCSLKLTHRGMATSLLKPRIALVANSIVFQREENRLISLDTLTMQEEEYIKNVAQKLLQCKPNLVLVEKTVSRLAQDIFLKEGVSLALNVKYRVLERLERLTGGKIITSIDSMLTTPVLGTCRSFYVETAADPRHRETLLVFDGCPPELGGTIILHGENRTTLLKLKSILKRLLLLKYNWKFEKGFILNEYGWIDKEKIEHWPDFELAVSPFIKVKEVDRLDQDLDQGQDAIENLEDLYTPRGSPLKKPLENIHPWCKTFISDKLSKPASEVEVQDSLALFRAAGWRVEKDSVKKPVVAEKHKLLVPLPTDHCEVLPVLFSSYSVHSTVYPNFCVTPWVVNMGLFGTYDISLGGFLENFCFNTEYICPNRGCNTAILEHIRKFCHGGGAVSVHMQQLEAPIMGEETDRLMMWKYCTQCELITPIVPVTSETWSLSFAMFLHLLLHENKLTRRGSDRPDAKCCHSLHQEHLTCFGKLDAVATFKYQPLQLMKLVPPCPNPELPENLVSHAQLLKQLKNLKEKGSSVYSAVLEKLHDIKGENEALIKKMLLQQEEDFKVYRARVNDLEEQIDRCRNKDEQVPNVESIQPQDRCRNKDEQVPHAESIQPQDRCRNKDEQVPHAESIQPQLAEQDSDERVVDVSLVVVELEDASNDLNGDVKTSGELGEDLQGKNLTEDTPYKDQSQEEPRVVDTNMVIQLNGIDIEEHAAVSPSPPTVNVNDLNQTLKLLSRDVMLAQQQWNSRLIKLYSTAHRFSKKSSSSVPVEQENLQQLHHPIKKQESTDTVKKFISTILPHEREEYVSSPFDQGTHLITTVAGVLQDHPSPLLVEETEPSSIIHFLLNSEAYKSFVQGSEDTNPHLELQFSSETAQFYSCSYFTKQFHNLRTDIFGESESKFLSCLSSCRRWEAMGGKSGLLFFKTRDDRFILKSMSRFEFQSFSEFAPHYFKYLKQCQETGTKTLLGKIVGVYKVGYKSEATRTGVKLDLLIMENLFYKKEVDKSYDLKGSVRNRLVATEGKKDQVQVLLDENLVRGSCESPLYINAADKDLLVDAIKRDTAFLATHHMMDYSLLAGICRNSGELVVGIIDYIRTFTWDKKLETLVKSVKSSGVFGGPAKTPTVINPEFYRKRFTDAMDSYFLLVPD